MKKRDPELTRVLKEMREKISPAEFAFISHFDMYEMGYNHGYERGFEAGKKQCDKKEEKHEEVLSPKKRTSGNRSKVSARV